MSRPGTRTYGKKPPEIKEGPAGGTLFAGPWCGEFGWELCSWNPIIRKMAKKYDNVIVEVQPGSEYLYEFADEIRINKRTGAYDMYKGAPSQPPNVPGGATHIIPMRFWKSHIKFEFREIKNATRNKSLYPREYRKFGQDSPQDAPADIMCAFRGPKVWKGKTLAEKQYPMDKAVELVRKFQDAGYSVACYGGRDNQYVEGTVDLRGTPLKELCGMLASAKLAVGPSSGTIHLASLCGTPHVSWYGVRNDSMDRYQHYWNPFHTPVTFINVPNPEPELALATSIDRLAEDTPTLHKVNK